MTLDQATEKSRTSLRRFFDAHREKLIEEFSHATDEELAAILERHDRAHEEAQRWADGIVTGAWYTDGETGGVH